MNKSALLTVIKSTAVWLETCRDAMPTTMHSNV
jgi:hypothetical protein